jgi:hypothetical protein
MSRPRWRFAPELLTRLDSVCSQSTFGPAFGSSARQVGTGSHSIGPPLVVGAAVLDDSAVEDVDVELELDTGSGAVVLVDASAEVVTSSLPPLDPRPAAV